MQMLGNYYKTHYYLAVLSPGEKKKKDFSRTEHTYCPLV